MINVDIFSRESFIGFIDQTFKPKEIIHVDSSEYINGIYDEGSLKNLQVASIKTYLSEAKIEDKELLELDFLLHLTKQFKNKRNTSVFIRLLPTFEEEKGMCCIRARIGII